MHHVHSVFVKDLRPKSNQKDFIEAKLLKSVQAERFNKTTFSGLLHYVAEREAGWDAFVFRQGLLIRNNSKKPLRFHRLAWPLLNFRINLEE